MVKHLSIIIFAILTLAAKQPTFGSTTLEDPLNVAWNQAHQIAAQRSQYLKAVLTVMQSEEAQDREYKARFFNIHPSLDESFTLDLHYTQQIWALFERTFDHYQETTDRIAMLELLLEEISRISYLADCDWVNRVMGIGAPVTEDTMIYDLMPSSCPFGKPIKIPVQKKDGSIQTYLIVPSMDILTQYGYEEHVTWRGMQNILRGLKEDYSPTIDTRNALGNGVLGVDLFFQKLKAYEEYKKTENYSFCKTVLEQLNAMPSTLTIATLSGILIKKVYPVQNLIYRLPLKPVLPFMADGSIGEEEMQSKVAAASLDARDTTSPEVHEVKDSAVEITSLSSAIDTVMLNAALTASPSTEEPTFLTFPKRLNAKGERAKARERRLRESEAVSAAGGETTTPSSTFNLNAKHYRTLETILNVLTARKPPKWDAFKNMIQALGGTTHDSAGNGTTQCIFGNRIFSIHTPHEKGNSMYWAQIKQFAKPGLERVGITLETVRPKSK